MSSWPPDDGTLPYETYLDLLDAPSLDRNKPPSAHLKVRVRVGLVDGRWELVEISLLADPIVHGADPLEWSTAIHAVDVRKLRPAELVKRAVAANRRGAERILHAASRPEHNPAVPPAAAQAAQEHLDRLRASPRARYDEEHYREVARVYLAAGGIRPTAAVAEQLNLTPVAAAKHVARARHRYGFLPATGGAQ